MDKNKYLFEIGVEELPASYIQPAIDFMTNYFDDQLHNHKIEFQNIEKYSTPRRLALIINGLSDSQKDSKKEITGPPKKIAYDTDGNLNKVGLGFLKKQNLSEKDIVIKELVKGEYLTATKIIKGAPTSEILKQISIEVINKIQFPKTMRWFDNGISFARPIRWIVALFNQAVLSFQIGDVQSNRYSFGNRFENIPNKFEIKDIDEYQSGLEKHFVIPDREKRKKLIVKQIQETAKKVNGIPTADTQLIETVIDLVEYPSPSLGKFNHSFLKLPSEILITTLSEIKKCFSVSNHKGKLLPYFICIINCNPKTINKVKHGYERVINARLADAKFYFETDKKTKLIDRIESLKKITFQKDLGTLFDKTERMRKIGKYIADTLNYDDNKIDRAVLLSKTDLTTLMLGEKEYTKLQGFMGWQYALCEGENKEVAKAIFEQYLPRYKDDILPETKTGIALSLVDKIDTICGCFSVGLSPSGSYDPLGLRRAGSSIIKILDNKNLSIPLNDIIKQSLKYFIPKEKKDVDSVQSELLSFFKQRIKNHFRQPRLRDADKSLQVNEIDYDVSDAVMASGFFDIPDLIIRAKKLQIFKSHEDFRKFIIGFKRASNILSDSEYEAKLDIKLFQHNEEKNLYEKVMSVIPEYEKSVNEKNYQKSFDILVSLKDDIDDFFDNVMVMVEDKKIRENRMALLRIINQTFLKTADLSKIVYEI
ncbi:MAG: glycine--tRNA ligase subunit beta [Candidatus Cloacimonetes bacterium]|nr:glycine--tRNA ligase subunit beta [Candidatus Cloacimonadota bacterium]